VDNAAELGDTMSPLIISQITIINDIAAIVGMPTIDPAITGFAHFIFVKKHRFISCFLYFRRL